MDFDFHEQYKDYSNIELLKILKQPADYQPAAITAATQILNERQVTPEEIQFVDQYFEEIDSSAAARQEKIEAVKNKAADFFEPVLYPSEKSDPRKWVNILLLAILLQYIWSLWGTIRFLIADIQYTHFLSDVYFYIELITLIYIPLIFFLLYKKKRWGWILLFADNLFALVSLLSQSYIFFKYQSIHHTSTTSFLFHVFIKAAFVFFLARPAVMDYFRITPQIKNRTALIVIVGTLLLILAFYLYSQSVGSYGIS